MGVPNPPAFPVPAHPNYPRQGPQSGMTLRDYFAGQALNFVPHPSLEVLASEHGPAVTQRVAAYVYHVADAMLAERARGGAE